MVSLLPDVLFDLIYNLFRSLSLFDSPDFRRLSQPLYLHIRAHCLVNSVLFWNSEGNRSSFTHWNLINLNNGMQCVLYFVCSILSTDFPLKVYWFSSIYSISTYLKVYWCLQSDQGDASLVGAKVILLFNYFSLNLYIWISTRLYLVPNSLYLKRGKF